MNGVSLSLHFTPLVPAAVLLGFGAVALCLFILSFIKTKHISLWRALTAAAFLLVLANPSLLEEQREGVNDVAALVIDQSPSQKMGKREERTNSAFENVIQALEEKENLEVRVIRAPEDGTLLSSQTDLFSALQSGMADVPPSRRAGAIFLTDGQVHDALADNDERLSQYGPIHTLLSGERNEKDRQIKIINAPAYGLVGEDIEITYRIEETDGPASTLSSVILRKGGTESESRIVPVNKNQTARFTINNAGQNIYELEVEAVPGELTEVNNKVAFVVNGVRDRLKVLLVSGQPHNGGRTWRDMLTSDPGVDLVHFTILREPDKLDQTPQRELSLIAFPFRELFEIKLYDFDLIIFDRYRLNRILPTYYFANIARYVREGGALLESSGPSFAGESSLYNTELESIFPGIPTGDVFEQAFRPEITRLGLNHPVTMDFQNMQPYWGRWLRQVAILADRGDTVLKGIDGRPLMILNRVGKGRIAQIASDQIWLWSRGYDGGGPHRDLLRRTVHWLMKEPELEENALDAIVQDDRLLIRRRSLDVNKRDVSIKKPDGQSETITLARDGDIGWLTGRLAYDQLGVYSISDGDQNYSVIVGDLTTPEMSDVVSTDKVMKTVADATGGSIRWLENRGTPNIRMLPEGRRYQGSGWIGLRQNKDFNVTGIIDRPFLPGWLSLLLLMALSVWMWWREGKTT